MKLKIKIIQGNQENSDLSNKKVTKQQEHSSCINTVAHNIVNKKKKSNLSTENHLNEEIFIAI